MNELLSAWVKPEYMPMLAIIALTVKMLMVPAIKAVWGETHPKGHSSIDIAFACSIGLAFTYKWLSNVGVWDAKGIVMTIIVGVMAACTAIGGNVTVQSLKGNDVSIKR